MIKFVSGAVVSVEENIVVLDVSGFGMEIICSREALSLCELGKKVTLPTYLAVSESGPSLFGFGDDFEREFFLMLKNVKGMGARTAISILRWLSARELIEIIAEKNLEKLEKVPGVGRKTAERICFELKDKTKKLFTGKEGTYERSDKLMLVRLALKELNFSEGEIDRAIGSLQTNAKIYEESEEMLLQKALKVLSE